MISRVVEAAEKTLTSGESSQPFFLSLCARTQGSGTRVNLGEEAGSHVMGEHRREGG